MKNGEKVLMTNGFETNVFKFGYMSIGYDLVKIHDIHDNEILYKGGVKKAIVKDNKIRIIFKDKTIILERV